MNIFNGNVDNKGNVYYNCYSNIPTEAIVCYGKINVVFKGNPKIVVRKGTESVFGEQILFQFLIDNIIEKYPARSPHSVIEYYLPLKEGLKFLKDTIKYIEEVTSNV